MRIFATVLAVVLFAAVIAMFVLSYCGIQWQSLLAEKPAAPVAQTVEPPVAAESGFKAKTGVNSSEASRISELSSRRLDGEPPSSRGASPESRKGVTVRLNPKLRH